MTAISKELFYKQIDASVRCNQIHFWEPDCIKAIFSTYLASHTAKGSAKFFLPIYILKLLINYKKINKVELWKQLVISECRSTAYGVTMGLTLISSICMLRKASGRVHYYNLLFLPGILSGLSVLLESKENQMLDTLIFFNSFVEAVLRNLNEFDIFKLTASRQTIIFAMVSATLMHLMVNRNKNIDFIYLWFYTPPKRREDDTEKRICDHQRGCYQYSFQGLWKYFTLGYAINIIRKLLPKVGMLVKKPLVIFRIIFNKANFKLGLFFGSYVGLYRIVTCSLLRTKVKKKFHSLVAGLISGLTYAISPNIQVLVVGITTLLQLLYELISDKFNITRHFWQRQALFMFCHGTLLHNKMYYPNTCPVYYKNMIDACTNNMTRDIWEHLITKYFM